MQYMKRLAALSNTIVWFIHKVFSCSITKLCVIANVHVTLPYKENLDHKVTFCATSNTKLTSSVSIHVESILPVIMDTHQFEQENQN